MSVDRCCIWHDRWRKLGNTLSSVTHVFPLTALLLCVVAALLTVLTSSPIASQKGQTRHLNEGDQKRGQGVVILRVANSLLLQFLSTYFLSKLNKRKFTHPWMHRESSHTFFQKGLFFPWRWERVLFPAVKISFFSFVLCEKDYNVCSLCVWLNLFSLVLLNFIYVFQTIFALSFWWLYILLSLGDQFQSFQWYWGPLTDAQLLYISRLRICIYLCLYSHML